MTEKNLKLRYLCLLHRHGDRAPIFFPPGNPNVSHWPDGAASLTKKGRTEMYNLGLILRRRYDTFLGDKLFSKDLYVRSTDANRCLTSAQCCLAGLFPPINDDEKITPNLNWQPIAIHTQPESIDPFAIRLPEKFIIEPRIPNGTYEDKIHDKANGIFIKHRDVYDYVDTTINSKGDFTKIMLTIDAVLVEANNNLTIDEKWKKYLPDFKEVLSGLHCCCGLYKKTKTMTVRLLDEIMTNMERFIENPSSTPKTSIYSLHDYNLVPLIATLTDDIIYSLPASCLIFELYIDEDVDNSNEFYIKLLFINNHDSDPIELKFKNELKELINFNDFKKVVQDLVETSKEKCHWTINGEPLNSVTGSE